METYTKLLKEFISFKSISTDTNFKDECIRTALWLEKLFKERGFEVTYVDGYSCNPVIIAKYTVSENMPTICVYGHYDVQPTDQNGWKSDPFTVEIDEKYLYARGVVDNKGQVLVHIASVFDTISENNISKNVVFIIEDNEESGNNDLPEIIKKYLPEIDYTIISDGEIIQDYPTIEVSLRGGANIKVNLQTANTDVHSGMYGGAIPNAVEILTKLLSSLKDENGVLLDKFYDGIDFGQKIFTTPSTLNIDSKDLISDIGVKNLCLEKGNDFYEQVGKFPTIQITGIAGGYTGNGFANIVPAQAEARINLRTVNGQNTKEILDNLEKYLRGATPEYAEITFEKTDAYTPILLDIESKNVTEISELLQKSFSKKVLHAHVGGGIPIVNDFIEITGKEVILVPLGSENCNMHGSNERYEKSILEKSISFAKSFWS